MISIQPHSNGLPPRDGVSLNVRVEFNTGDETSRVFWQLFDSENQQLTSGNLFIPEEIHNAWGTDDSIVDDYVLEQLGLTRI